MKGYSKHRGLKRYYKNLAVKDDLEDHNWLAFDNPHEYWHLHFDMHGYGNESFRRRKPHLDKLFRHFDMLVEKTKALKTNYQLYALILDYHSYSDALFLHPPTPNDSQFPFKISDLKSTTTLKNTLLNEYLDNLAGYEKLYGQTGEAFCFLFKKGVGQPLDKNTATGV